MSIFYRRDLVTDQKLEKRLETEADLVNGKVLTGQLPNTVATKEYVDAAVAGSSSAVSFNFTGAYSIGSAYAVGDVATYEGKTWYRINSNGGNVGDTPVEGTFWTLIAQYTEPAPLFSEVVEVVAPINGQVDLSEHNFKTIKLNITGLDSNPSLQLTLPLYCMVIFTNAGETDGNLDLILGTTYNGTFGQKIHQSGGVPNINDGICISGVMNFSITDEKNKIIRMNYFIEFRSAVEL